MLLPRLSLMATARSHWNSKGRTLRAISTAFVPTGRILDAAALVHAVMKDAARAEGPEGPKLLGLERA